MPLNGQQHVPCMHTAGGVTSRHTDTLSPMDWNQARPLVCLTVLFSQQDSESPGGAVRHQVLPPERGHGALEIEAGDPGKQRCTRGRRDGKTAGWNKLAGYDCDADTRVAVRLQPPPPQHFGHSTSWGGEGGIYVCIQSLT